MIIRTVIIMIPMPILELRKTIAIGLRQILIFIFGFYILNVNFFMKELEITMRRFIFIFLFLFKLLFRNFYGFSSLNRHFINSRFKLVLLHIRGFYSVKEILPVGSQAT